MLITSDKPLKMGINFKQLLKCSAQSEPFPSYPFPVTLCPHAHINYLKRIRQVPVLTTGKTSIHRSN